MSYLTKVNVSNGLDGAVIVAESTRTLRSLFEEANVKTNRGILQFNGAILTDADMDSTLDDLVTNPDATQILRMTVKADNACKAIIAGSSVVICSSATPEQLKTLKRYCPDYLQLKSANGDVEFMVSVSDGAGSVNKVGIVFSNRTDANGNATVTLDIPSEITDVKTYVEEMYGFTLLKLNKLEAEFARAFSEAHDLHESIEDVIVIQ